MNSPKLMIRNVGIHLLTAICLPIIVCAQTAPRGLTESSLEDLMNMQVTSVSKKEQKLSQAGGSIFVITQDDIRHSGATNI
jgi:iron complex outermembrane receptor protein